MRKAADFSVKGEAVLGVGVEGTVVTPDLLNTLPISHRKGNPKWNPHPSVSYIPRLQGGTSATGRVVPVRKQPQPLGRFSVSHSYSVLGVFFTSGK